jgi:hypothetical protein
VVGWLVSGVAVHDQTGSVYVVGKYASVSFTFGNQTLTNAGGPVDLLTGRPSDMFMVKLRGSDGAIEW